MRVHQGSLTLVALILACLAIACSSNDYAETGPPADEVARKDHDAGVKGRHPASDGGTSDGGTSTGGAASTGSGGSGTGSGGSGGSATGDGGILPPPPPSGLALAVAGNHLVDAGGHPVRLLGVDRSGQEFKCIQGGAPGSLGWGIFDGPTDLASAQAIASWHANTVRVPLNEDCWLGINGVNPLYSGAAYQAAIAAYVATLHQAGLYVILDLHWTSPGTAPAAAQQPMPDADHAIDFWRSVASAFGSDPAVVLDLFNEPYLYGSDTSNPSQDPWDCWLNGCSFKQYVTGGTPYQQAYTWSSVGMQALVDTVRATGARNVIMAGGLEWSNDLTGWLTHRPQDPLQSIAASWHSYPGQTCSDLACWTSVIEAVAAQVPIITGETGDSVCAASSYTPTLLPWADAHGLSYLGWTWNTWGDCANILIKDYDGTPTPNYGQAFHDLLVAATP